MGGKTNALPAAKRGGDAQDLFEFARGAGGIALRVW